MAIKFYNKASDIHGRFGREAGDAIVVASKAMGEAVKAARAPFLAEMTAQAVKGLAAQGKTVPATHTMAIVPGKWAGSFGMAIEPVKTETADDGFDDLFADADDADADDKPVSTHRGKKVHKVA